jgi:hypothetical protein
MILTALAGACDQGSSSPRSDRVADAEGVFSPADVARREALREELRDRLGESYDAPLAFDGDVRYDRGAQLYAMLCEGCHGSEGRGDGRVSDQLSVPPGDLGDAEQAGFWSDRARLEIIRHGSPGTPMLGWGEVLAEADLAAVSKYVSSLVPMPEDAR